MYLKFLVFSVCIFTVMSQRKSGDCPPSVDVGECSFTCRSDANCPGNEKCCRTSCHGTFCVAPITSRNTESLKVKIGSCPERPTGAWVCSSRCVFDSDCRGRKKCCRNRCGALACMNPE